MELKLDHTFAYQNCVPIRWSTFGNGPPLVFIHGTPWSSQLWYPIARCLASSFAVYLFDLPGYGHSQPIPGSDYQPTYPAQTKAFCALLQHWRSTRESKSFVPHVVAHDIGGHIALRAVLMEHLIIKSLTLVDCGASYPVDEPFFSLVRENSCVFMSLPPALHQAMLREYVRRASYRGLRKDQEDMLVQPWLSDDGQKGFYAQIKAQKNTAIEELRKTYRKLDIPLQIVWGRNDTWVPLERAYKLQEFIGGILTIIENAGHLVQLDAPEELTAVLFNWLQSQKKI